MAKKNSKGTLGKESIKESIKPKKAISPKTKTKKKNISEVEETLTSNRPKSKYKIGDKVRIGLFYYPYIFEGEISEMVYNNNKWVVWVKDNDGQEVVNSESDIIEKLR